MADNDIIVHRADAARARDALLAIGYEQLPFFRLEALLEIDFQLPLRRSFAGAVVSAEIHWNAFPPLLYPVPETLLWEHLERFELRGAAINVFDKPLTIVHLGSHFAQHLFSQPRILRDLAAAWNLWHREIDVGVLLRLADETGLQNALAYAFSCARDLEMLQADPPAILSKRAALLRRLLPARRIFEKRPEQDYARILLAFLLAAPRQLPTYAYHRFFPPIDMMAMILRQPVSPALYLRYFTRPFRPLARLLGKKF